MYGSLCKRAGSLVLRFRLSGFPKDIVHCEGVIVDIQLIDEAIEVVSIYYPIIPCATYDHWLS